MDQMVTIGIATGAIGLILVILRYLSVTYLSARVLVYLTLMVLIGAVAYYAYYFTRVFPSRMVAYQANATRRKYMPKPVPAASRSSKKKSKRRK
jgi:hypothetical protein